MILSRQEFADHFEQMKPGLGAEDSPLWNAEYMLLESERSQFFVMLSKSIVFEGIEEFHDWKDECLKGKVRCYSSGHVEWWGFQYSDDITPFILRWA